MDKVFIEENNHYQIDFSNAKWINKDLNNIFHSSNTPMSDVDVVVEYVAEPEDDVVTLMFVEYKNGNIENAAVPFSPFSDKKVNNVVRKYYDSLFYIITTRRPVANYSYVYIVEYPNSDKVTRGLLRERIAKRLPFKLQKSKDIKIKLIDKFEVLSIDEWNNHVNYSKFPISKVITSTT